jgi:2OG-Fe(II) oxygenase superfamily
MTDSPLIRVSGALTLPDLLALTRGTVLALRVPDFHGDVACAAAAAKLLAHPARAGYQNAPQIGRIGMSYFEGRTAEGRGRYHAAAQRTAALLHEAYVPHQDPIESLMQRVGDAWPGGSRLEAVEGMPMFAGLVRTLEAGTQLRPHQDLLEWDAPEGCSVAGEFVSQLAANVYLQTGPEGGVLELWDFGLERVDYERQCIPGRPALDRDKLPLPALRIAPRTGDLIIFSSHRLHAVTPVVGDPRVTASCFIGVRGIAAPMTFWS